ncbi:phosphopentomutase [Clostridium sp. OS1-26]|uniref:phosphopentomutase n=1 Tax=Clostridium sp. OS1-26 TaxID=3070681 RepID=UPI0027DECCA3|nr:phosphopentomutase [Clostridium sp. OS1-26]WML34923.1 phosphopentomutase [Clostridium sp. OS1-26]
MNRFIVIILDGFGVGYMKDVEEVRPADLGANTCKHILEKKPEVKLPNIEKLGLMNALGEAVGALKPVEDATFGKAELTHFGADTFMGHQEIMGTLPKMPVKESFTTVINKVYDALKYKDYKVEIKEGKESKFLIVNNALTVADNIEADLGQAYNITATLDILPFEDVLKIGKIVREHSRVSRVITFGGKGITLQDILNAVEEKGNGFIGINAPKSGVYNKGYQCIHLGYGIDPEVQVPTILARAGIKVTLLGKVADIVSNDYGKSISCVDTEEVLKLTIEELKLMDKGFICTNVQETDLCGHRENVEEYIKKLIIADEYLGKIMERLEGDDILLVMADHGNDPTIGHSRHTREMVPVLVFGPKVKKASLGIRSSLSDVGATVADYFGYSTIEHGHSFLDIIV